MEDEYTYTPFTSEKINDITRLMSAIYGHAVSDRYIRKKYAEFKPGFSPVGFIAYGKLNREPAAYYGIFPVQVFLKGKIYFAAQSGDTMTHPEHRGKGLFIRLAKMTYEKAKETGLAFIFGFPNDNSYPGFSGKLNWIFLGKMKKYSIWIYTFPLSVIAYKSRFLLPFFKKFVRCLLLMMKTERTSFDNSSITDKSGGILRNDAFMHYKTYGNNYLISSAGTKIWIEPSKRLIVGDIEFIDHNASLRTLNKLKLLSGLLGIPRIDFEVSPGSSWDLLLSKYYRSIDSYPIGFLNLGSEVDLDQIQFNYADYDFF